MRLIDEADVVKAIDKHTQPDGTLDNDISCILEEVPTDKNKEKVIKEIRNVPHGYYNAETEDEIIEIVEKGGIE